MRALVRGILLWTALTAAIVVLGWYAHDKLEQRRVLEVRSGNNNRVNILLGEQVLEVCERPRFPLIDLPGCLSGSIAIYFP